MESLSRRERIRYRENLKIKYDKSQPGNWGTIKLKNGMVIVADWKEDKINFIHHVELPTEEVNVQELLPYVSDYSKLNQPFYSAIQHIPNTIQTDVKNIFFDNLKRTRGKIRLISLCHSQLLQPIPLSLKKIHRISSVPQGVCSIIDNNYKVMYSNQLLQPMTDTEFTTLSKDICMTQILMNCSVKLTVDPSIQKEYDKTIDICSTLTSTPEKEFSKNDRIFNKLFTSHSGLCFLYVGFKPYGMDHYMYKNIFSIIPLITLESILHDYIPNCSEVTWIDFGCSKPHSSYIASPSDYTIYGGQQYSMTKKRKSKSRHKKLKMFK